MRHSLLLSAIAFAGSVPGQGLTLAVEALSPTATFVAATNTGPPVYLPAGPVAFPVHLTTPVLLTPSASLDLGLTSSGSTTTLSIVENMFGYNFRFGLARCLLRLTLAAPLPARVSLPIYPTLNWGLTVPSHDAAVDIGADGSQEYAYTYAFPTPPPAGNLEVLVDARGTPIDVGSNASIGASAGVGTATAQIVLQFTAPVHDASYGSPCGAEFGSQLDPANPFARTFVASLPGNSILAWFVGGDQQANVTVPGITCPLLTNNVVVISVPLVPGSNGRSMAVLDLLLPPLPGATWYAQGVGFAGGTFVGTNGAIIQT